MLLLLALPVSTQTQITVCTNKTVSGGNGSDGETWQIVVTLVMLVATLVAMAKEVGPADMLMMLMLIGVLACGIVDVKEAVQGLFLLPTNTKFAHLQLRSPLISTSIQYFLPGRTEENMLSGWAVPSMAVCRPRPNKFLRACWFVVN